ncbi:MULTISPECIES: YqgE/AlgH family protein [Kordiimonas]|uniref:YqgE/AlgH family protein n=1 Tax=Kordiimonas TaxID=288021 RepID=UPI001FF5EDB5|nr:MULTISPECIES: YqgE/AlgH family protein [Kordiimonas]MCK0068830.1 YqgE/AlgH family protein [Kordiimonas laminariae]UTW58181.1 YqgE/AlgH family protein [Kordiimonas sp. SCSIO 12603]
MTSANFLDSKLLLAMPSMTDERFDRTVIYLCTHDESGAMGLVINQQAENLNFEELLTQLNIETHPNTPDIPVHRGGPVEPGRGFVLHSADFVQDSTLVVSETLALTATVDILSAMAEGKGPIHNLLALGYAGWGPGQLEDEIIANSWLTAEADEEIIFNTDFEQKWPRAMAKLGVNISMLSTDAGHA